jgi:hypothetical protein
MVANSYSESGTNFTVANTMTEGFRQTVYHPQKVYLTVLGSDGFNYVDLNIQVWSIDNPYKPTPPPPVPTPTPTPAPKPTPTPTPTPTPRHTDTDTNANAFYPA